MNKILCATALLLAFAGMRTGTLAQHRAARTFATGNADSIFAAGRNAYDAGFYQIALDRLTAYQSLRTGPLPGQPVDDTTENVRHMIAFSKRMIAAGRVVPEPAPVIPPYVPREQTAEEQKRDSLGIEQFIQMTQRRR